MNESGKQEGQDNLPNKVAASNEVWRRLNEQCRSIASNPMLQVGLIAITIASVIFAIYTWQTGIRERELTIYSSPTRTPIVQQGVATNISVTINGQPLTGDLSSAEIQIWNAGKEPIRREHILTPLTIRTPSNQPIYQVTYQTTRDVIGFTNTISTNGVVTLDWRIMEKGDGVRIQFIHEGNVRQTYKIHGEVEGQSWPFPVQKAPPNHRGGWRQFWASMIALGTATIWGFMTIPLLLRAAKVTFTQMRASMPHWTLETAIVCLLIAVLVLGGTGIYLGVKVAGKLIAYPQPPFGF